MTQHPNVELTRQGYEAFAKGDLAALSGLIADDVTWHVLGIGPLSGDYRGRDGVFGFASSRRWPHITMICAPATGLIVSTASPS